MVRDIESNHSRFGNPSRVSIIESGYKLLIALWRFATQGVIPEGAVLKPAA